MRSDLSHWELAHGLRQAKVQGGCILESRLIYSVTIQSNNVRVVVLTHAQFEIRQLWPDSCTCQCTKTQICMKSDLQAQKSIWLKEVMRTATIHDWDRSGCLNSLQKWIVSLKGSKNHLVYHLLAPPLSELTKNKDFSTTEYHTFLTGSHVTSTFIYGK